MTGIVRGAFEYQGQKCSAASRAYIARSLWDGGLRDQLVDTTKSISYGDVTDFSHFDPTAADFEMVIPNLCNDMHDCSVATGDAFLRSFVPRITDSPAFADSVLFITWDEGTSSEGGGGHVALVATSPLAPPGRTSGKAHDHYSLLHTIEEAWGLPCLSNACGANDLADLFR